MKGLMIGQLIEIDCNTAKYFGDKYMDKTLRVEAVGVDWLVARDRNGKSHALTCDNSYPAEEAMRGIKTVNRWDTDE